MPLLKRPYVASPNQAHITREGETAIIEYAEPDVWTTRLTIGPKINSMSNEEILELHNDCIRGSEEFAAEQVYVAVEVPPGKPQIKYFEVADQWTPRAGVLRCLIEDKGADSEPSIYIDKQELSLHEFGKMLSTYSGWGMRITFVPEDELDEKPTVVLRDPDEEN